MIYVSIGARKDWKLPLENVEYHGFEPRPDRELREKLPPNAILYTCAIGAEKDERDFFITKHPGCSSLLTPDMDVIQQYECRRVMGKSVFGKPISVDKPEPFASYFEIVGKQRLMVQPLDAFNLSPDILKVDIQGGEYSALLGARDTLKRTKRVEIELNTVSLYRGQAHCWELQNLLYSLGFHLSDIHNEQYAKRKDGTVDMISFDGVFTR